MDVVNQVIDDLKREVGKPSCWNFMCEVSWGEFQDILGEGQDENRPFFGIHCNGAPQIMDCDTDTKDDAAKRRRID